MREADAVDLARLLTPLKIKWWCEGRIDTLLRYSGFTICINSGSRIAYLSMHLIRDSIM